jgi:nucleoside-diphosphate-sugar epimerase
MMLRDIVKECAAAVGAPPPRLRVPRAAAFVAGLSAELGGRMIGRNPPVSRRTLAFFENDNAFDCTAAKRDLGFVPRVGFAEGLRRTLADPTGPIPL